MSDNTLTIAVMGATGTGKSTFVNLASGSHFEVGTGLLSCTPAVQTTNPFHFMGRTVTLIDTPGFDDSTKSDREILQLIADHLSKSFRENKKLSGIIYMHRISDFKMSGISRRNFLMFRSLCGESTFRNVAIVTNMWGEVNEERGAAREKELATSNILFKPVLDKGATMLRNRNTKEAADAILRHFLNNHPIALQIQEELVNQNKPVDETAAGAQLEEEKNRDMEEQKRKHEEELRKQREEAERLQREQMERQRQQVEAARRAHEAEMERLRIEQERERQRWEEQQRRDAEQRAALQRRMAEEAAARFRQEQEAERIRKQIEEDQRREREEHARLQEQLRQAQVVHEHHDGGCSIF